MAPPEAAPEAAPDPAKKAPDKAEPQVIPGVVPAVIPASGVVPDAAQAPTDADLGLPPDPTLPDIPPTDGMLPIEVLPEPLIPASEADMMGEDEAGPGEPEGWLASLGNALSGGGSGGGGGAPIQSSGLSENAGMAQTAGGLQQALSKRFGAAASSFLIYDSNPFRSNGGAGGSDGDFIYTIGGVVGFHSPKAAVWTYAFRYSAGYNYYFNESTLSSDFHSGSALLNYNGGKLTGTLQTSIQTGLSANRTVGGMTDQTTGATSLVLRYQFRPKTSFQSTLLHNYTSIAGAGGTDTSSLDWGLSGLWRYSPRLEFGPGLRYTLRSGSTQESRTTLGPTLLTNYKMSTKVSFVSRVGMDFVEFETTGRADPTFAAMVQLSYRASARWGMNVILQRDSQAEPGVVGAFSDSTTLRLGYQRKIRRADFNAGLSYDIGEISRPGVAATVDREFVSADSSLEMPLFARDWLGRVFVRYSQQDVGGTGWDGVQVGLGVSHQF